MLRLFTFGSVELQDPSSGEAGAVLAQPKRLALLVYLAAARPFGVHRRDELLALFWPDLDDTRARDALNQALRFLRQALGPEVFVRRGGEDVGIDPARLWCDAAAFQVALDAGRPADALQLYRGDFLQGFFIEEGGGFEEWLERERTAHRDSAGRGARQLAETHASEGALTLAIDWGRRALEFAPDDERALRRLLRWHDRAGDRAGAFRVYEAFARRFEQEFGCEPSEETRELIEKLKASRPLTEERVVARPTAPSPRPLGKDPESDLGDRYRIVRKLGSGGMATVYLAQDLKHDREVALKVLRPEISEGLARERFIREIRIAGRLQHPNIVPLFDSGVADERLYYVMAHIEGETLRDRLTREGRFEVSVIQHFLREIAGALAYAHERGVIHRDIKPENILLIDRRAVLTDFGIARAALAARTSAEPYDQTLTQPGTSLGTPAYMAPEQAAGNPEVDHRADLYALGVLGYEMLAGRTPFVGSSAQQVLMAQIVEQPVAIGEIRVDTPASLGALVMRCLEKQPAERPESANAFLAGLDGGTAVMRTTRVGKRVSAAAALSLAAVAAALGLLLWLSWTTGQPDNPDPFAGQATQVAVRPFSTSGGPGVDESIATALTTDLTTDLGRIPALHVRTASALGPLGNASPDSIRRALGVGLLIEGSVARRSNALQVRLGIVETRDGREAVSRTWIIPAGSILAQEGMVVAQMATFVNDWIVSQIQGRRQRLGTRSRAAWDRFVVGISAFEEAKRLYASGESAAPRDLARVADSLLREAEQLDRDWLEPPLARGWLLTWRAASVTASRDTALRWRKQAMELADWMLAKHRDLPEAMELRGGVALRMAIDAQADSLALRRAISDLRHAAVPTNSTAARAWHLLGVGLRLQGQAAEANVVARRAYELDPFMELARDLLAELCATSFELGQLADAESWCREGRRRYPEAFEFPYYMLQAMSLNQKARPSVDSAWAVYHELDRATPPAERMNSRPGWLMMVAGAAARAGLTDSARRILTAARRLPTTASDVDVYEAAAWTLIGNMAAALDRLESYLTKHPLKGAMVAAHPSFASLVEDSRFQRLTRSTQ